MARNLGDKATGRTFLTAFPAQGGPRRPELTGPRGGVRLSYRRLDGHYLRTEPFIELVRSGYVGTRGATTAHLQALIDASLNGGKAVVAGVQSALGDAMR